MKSIFKRSLAVFLISLALISVCVVSASATTYASTSTMTLVDPNTHKTASTLYLYGRADYICMKLNNDLTEQGADRPTFVLYSDSEYKNKIAYYQSADPKEKTAYITLSLDLSNIKSGTYYAKTYIEKDDYTDFSIDKSTVKTYKIIVKKGGTTMTDMNTVMYGYENTENGPKIYWFGVPDATGYYVYRRNPDTKKYEKIKTVKDNDKKLVSYTDSGRKNVTSTEYYKVVAYKGSKKSPASLKSLKATVLKTPVITIEPYKNESIDISWSKVKSGAKYTVLMRTKDSDWKEVTNTKSTSTNYYFKSKAESNEIYYFTVIAEVDGVYSGYNVKGKAFRYVKEPTMQPCTYPDDGGITVNWDLVAGATQYAVYKKVEGAWQEVGLVDGEQTSYTDLTGNAYDGATYTVCSVANGAYKFYNAYGVYGIKFEKMLLNEIVEEDGKLLISWENPVENQSAYYRVYYKVNGGETSTYTSTSSKSCSFTPSRAINTYEFKVRAHKNYIDGPLDATGVSYTYYPQMHTPSVIADETGAYVSWRAMSGAEGYALYKKTADGEYQLLTETTKVSYFDSDIVSDTAYSYKVAYKYNGTIMTDKESSEKSVVFVDEAVNIVDEVYKPTYNGYYIKIADYNEIEASYKLYRKVEDKWGTVSGSLWYVDDGEIKIPILEGKQEFAILKTYDDGRIVRLPENGFVVDFDGAVDEIEIEADKNVVSFNWDPEALDADKVLIYKDKELFATVDKSEGGFTDDSAKANCYNNYVVYTQSENFISHEKLSKKHVYLETPDFTVSSYNGGVRIAWEDIEVDGFVTVYKAKGSSTTFEEFRQCYANSNSVNDIHTGSGSTYTYAIVLEDEDGNTTPMSSGKKIKYLDSPVITSAKSYKDGVKVVWREVEKAEGYIISYKKDGQWIQLADLASDTISYVDETVESGEKREYMVYAYSGNYKSAYDTRSTYYLERSAITSITSATTQFKINFTPVEGATKYKLYYKIDGSDDWNTLGTTTDTSYTYKTKRPGLKFYFTVSAVFEKGSREYYSYKCSSKTAKNLSTPLLDTISSTKSGIKFNWSITPYATGYNIYRKDSDGEFEKIAYVKGRETVRYVDETAKKGETYTYTVRAKYGDGVSAYNKTGLTCKAKY